MFRILWHCVRHAARTRSSLEAVQVFALRGVNVLIMSDESAERDLLKAVFERQGARVTAAYSTAEAVALVMRKRPDVFVADFEMAGPNSSRLLEAGGRGWGTKVPTITIVNEAPTTRLTRLCLPSFTTI